MADTDLDITIWTSYRDSNKHERNTSSRKSNKLEVRAFEFCWWGECGHGPVFSEYQDLSETTDKACTSYSYIVVGII